MKTVLLALLSFSFVGLAQPSENAVKNWVRVPALPFMPKISDGMFIADKMNDTAETFMPPVQYFVRPLKGDLHSQSLHLADDILTAFGVDAKSSMTIRMSERPVQVGPKHDREAIVLVYNSPNPDVKETTNITCMAFIKDQGKVTALYTQAFSTSLPHCAERIVELARSPDLNKN